MNSSVLDKQPSPGQGAPALILDQFTPYRIVALGHALSERLAQVYGDENITIPEWRVLAVIAQAREIAARDVVALTPMDKMTVSRAIASLEGKGYATRAVSARDSRVKTVSLTKAGRVLFERIAALALSFEDRLTDGLSPDERRIFLVLLKKLESAAAG